MMIRFPWPRQSAFSSRPAVSPFRHSEPKSDTAALNRSLSAGNTS